MVNKTSKKGLRLLSFVKQEPNLKKYKNEFKDFNKKTKKKKKK